MSRVSSALWFPFVKLSFFFFLRQDRSSPDSISQEDRSSKFAAAPGFWAHRVSMVDGFRIPKVSAERQREAAARAETAERAKLTEIRKELGLSRQDASVALPQAGWMARGGKRSAKKLAARRERVRLLGFNRWSTLEKHQQHEAWERRREQQLQGMQRAVAQAADL